MFYRKNLSLLPQRVCTVPGWTLPEAYPIPLLLPAEEVTEAIPKQEPLDLGLLKDLRIPRALPTEGQEERENLVLLLPFLRHHSTAKTTSTLVTTQMSKLNAPSSIFARKMGVMMLFGVPKVKPIRRIE